MMSEDGGEVVERSHMPNENRVTQDQINALLDSAHTEEAILHGKVLVVDYQFPSRAGFAITGRGAVIDPANFDIEIGRKVCRENAMHQLWQLEGYLKQLEVAGLINWAK
jgi:hypothetical protein